MPNNQQVFFELIENLQNDEQDDMSHETNYSNWVYDKSEYIPAVESKIVKKVEKGVYKITNNFYLSKQNISSDGLYKFTNSEINLILNEVNKFWEKKDIFIKNNLIHKRGILLEGPPGTGKSSIITLLIKELVSKNDAVIFLINNVNDFSKIYEFLNSTFRKIEPNRLVVTIIEDIDKISNTAIQPELLDFLDGKASINHHIVISTTNNTSDLPEALLRPSRIDRRFYIGFPSEKTRKEFFINKGVTEDKIDVYVEQSESLTISELKELFIGTYILENSFEEVIDQIKNPYEKKEYTIKNSSNITIEVE